MPDELQIYPAGYDDLLSVAQVHVTSWKQAYMGQVPQTYLDNLDVAKRLQAWQEQFSNRASSGLLIAKVSNTDAGFVCFGRARDQDRQDWGEIYAIYVVKEYWGRGVGYSLHKNACDELRKKGFQNAYLWVLDTNQRAIAAYQRWGGVVEHLRVKDDVISGQPVKEVPVRFDFNAWDP